MNEKERIKKLEREMKYLMKRVEKIEELIDIKGLEEKKKIKEELEEMSRRAIQNNLCRKCGGVKVNSMMTSYMAQSYGKTCRCKSKEKRKNKKKI